ncbi:hypothetical protein YC2023_027690 [Brassica napus]
MSVLNDSPVPFDEDRLRFHSYEDFEAKCDLKCDLYECSEWDGTWERSTWLNLSNTVTLWSSASPQFRQTSTTAEDGEGFVFLLKLELSYKRCLKGVETSLFGSIYTEGYRHMESGEPRREIGNMMKSGECCSTDALRFERLGGCKIKLGECKTRF